MLNVQFFKKLTQYSSLSGPIIALAGMANAQVVHTDVDPDYVLSDTPGGDGAIKAIDLNNDGVNDLVLAVFSSVSNGGSLQINRAGVQPYANNGNGVMGFSISGSSYYASALQMGDPIDDSKNFWNYLGYYGSLIWYSLSNQGTFGEWNNVQDRYLGVRFFDEDSNLHYGWVRMDVQNKPVKIMIKDFAYENIPDKGIMAGATFSLGQSSLPLNGAIDIFAFNKDVVIQDLANASGPMNLRITDVAGKTIHEQTTFENLVHLSLKNDAQGIYLVIVVKSGRIKTGKVYIR